MDGLGALVRLGSAFMIDEEMMRDVSQSSNDDMMMVKYYYL